MHVFAPMRPRVVVLLVVAIISASIFYSCTKSTEASADTKGPGGGGKKGGGGEVPVVVTKVSAKDAPIDIQVIGNAEAYSTISIRPQISGQIISAPFKEGETVKAGQLLFEIDRRLLEAQLLQMQSQLAKNEAQLQQAIAQAARDQATSEYNVQQAKRFADGASQGIFSKDQNDQIQAGAKASQQTVLADRAAIDSVKADIAATKATIENLKVQLSYTKITAPIAGRTGNVMVKVGNVAVANTSELVVINQVEPIYVSFSVPENQLDDIKKYMAQGTLGVIATPQDSDESERGKLTFVDNSVDTTTGTIRLKATFPNTNRNLWPGLFTRVTLRLGVRPNAVTVPNQVVQTGQAGTFVYVVKADRSVEARPVTVGNRVGTDMIIDDGLQVGETVVLDGQLRLAPGMKVVPRDPNQPAGGKGGKKGGMGGGAMGGGAMGGGAMGGGAMGGGARGGAGMGGEMNGGAGNAAGAGPGAGQKGAGQKGEGQRGEGRKKN